MSTATYLESLTDRVNAVDACSGLQEVAQEVKQAIEDKLIALAKNAASMAGSAQLIIPPTDPASAVNWIKNFIESDIKPIYQAYLATLQEIQATQQALVNVTQAIQNKSSEFLNCDILG